MKTPNTNGTHKIYTEFNKREFFGKEDKMKIEKISIDKIKPYENNAKLHPLEQIEQIKKSIKEFGNNDPIAIDENNVIIEGHGRYIALKKLNFKEIEVIRLSHLSKDEKRAYILIHNKLTMNTGFDIDILQAELSCIDKLNMESFGFGIEICESDEKPDEDPEFQNITFYFHKKQADLIKYVLDLVKDEVKETFKNPNKKGNAIYEVAKQWAELKKFN